MDIRKHACMHTRTHIHLSKLVTAMSRFTASKLNKKEQYSCSYSTANPKVWLYLYSNNVVGCNNIQCNFLVNMIVMSSNTSITSIFMLTLLHQEIEIVDSYKYLGVLFTQTYSFLCARKHIVQQAKKAMILLFTRMNNLDIPIDLQLKLFDHTVVPILTYACEVWGYENLDMIEKVQNDFLRRITCSKKCTPLYMLYGELGRYPLEITIKSRMIGFWYRITHGNPIKLSSVLYQCLLHSSHINSKWLTCIKSIFTKIGRPDIWQSQQNFHLKSVSFLVKKILIDQYMQDWYIIFQSSDILLF